MVMKMIENRINLKTGVSLRTEQYAALESTRGIRLFGYTERSLIASSAFYPTQWAT